MEISMLCQRLAKILKLPIREYQESGSLTMVYGKFNVLPDSFMSDSLLLQTYRQKNKAQLPLLITMSPLNPSAVVFDDVADRFFIIGTVKTIGIKGKPIMLPVDTDTLAEVALLLYEGISGRQLSAFELLTATVDLSRVQDELKQKVSELSFAFQESGELHNPYEQEQREQASIREGNHEKLLLSFRESYAGRLATLSKDRLRSAKNIGIVVLAISTRSAIAGGLHPEEAYTLSDSYILKIDEAKTEHEISQLTRGAEIHFTKLVYEAKGKKIENPLVLRTRSIIYKMLHEKIMVETVAKELQTSPNYLSTLFKKETGDTIHSFIVKEKMKVAESLLVYSDYTIEEISNYLAFSSQSHFGSLFKRHYQLTPQKYRQRHGVSVENR